MQSSVPKRPTDAHLPKTPPGVVVVEVAEEVAVADEEEDEDEEEDDEEDDEETLRLELDLP